MTDSYDLDVLTNEIIDYNNKPNFVSSRKKREITKDSNEKNVTNVEAKSKSDSSDDYENSDNIEFIDENLDENERGKRQIRHGRYYLKKNIGEKNWGSPKPLKFYDHGHFVNNPPSTYYSHRNPIYNTISYQEAGRKPQDNLFTTSNPYLTYTSSTNSLLDQLSNKQFKPSLRDPLNMRPPHNPINTATHIITKSPPISSLTNNENPFSALAGGFYNNAPVQSTNNNVRHNIQNYHDLSQLSSAPITNKPISVTTSVPKTSTDVLTHANQNKPYENSYETYEESDESGSSENNNDDFYKSKYTFPKPPYEFTHPHNKYADIVNPFADPDFDFDVFLKKLRDEPFTITGPSSIKSNNKPTSNNNLEITTKPNIIENSQPKPFKSSTIIYKGMSTPKPFTLPAKTISWSQTGSFGNTPSTVSPNITKYQTLTLQPTRQGSKQILNTYNNAPHPSTITQFEALRPNFQPPNFNDDRQLPLNHNFNIKFDEQSKSKLVHRSPNYSNIIVSTEAPKTYLIINDKNKHFLLSTPNPLFGTSQKTAVLQSNVPTGRPYSLSTVKIPNGNTIFKVSTPNTTPKNPQIPIKLQKYRAQYALQSSFGPNNVSEIPSLESMFSQAFKPTVQSNTVATSKPMLKAHIREITTTSPKPKRRPIPKPSPEMNDYYYDDDEQYYEPAVKPKYMPSSEVRPQRPPIAQNYEEYEDDESYEDDDNEYSGEPQNTIKRPSSYNTYQVDSATRNHNDVSVVTKSPYKNVIKNNVNGKIPVPVMMDIKTPIPTVLMRPEVSNYQIIHSHRNRTVHLRKPTTRPVHSGPNTIRPPKYLNQTTLRPYTVRHRLAKPTTVKIPSMSNDQNKQTRARVRRPTTVTKLKTTTPIDNYNQETRYTKTKHDDKTNR